MSAYRPDMDIYFLAGVSVLLVLSVLVGVLAYVRERARHLVRFRAIEDFLVTGGHDHARRRTRQAALRRILVTALSRD